MVVLEHDYKGVKSNVIPDDYIQDTTQNQDRKSVKKVELIVPTVYFTNINKWCCKHFMEEKNILIPEVNSFCVKNIIFDFKNV